MSTLKKADNIPVLTALTDSQVADYLRRNPDFLVDKPDVIAALDLPHQLDGKAVSLVERQVSVLRDRNMDMRRRLNSLLDNARNNDQLFEKTKRLVLSLLDTTQLDDILDALFFGLQNEFDIEFATMLVVMDEIDASVSLANQQARVIELKAFEDNLSSLDFSSKAICGQLNDKEQKFVFGDKSSQIGSTAISQIMIDDTCFAVLVIGNRDVNYYRASMNTLFLNFIADTLGRILSRYLNKNTTV